MLDNIESRNALVLTHEYVVRSFVQYFYRILPRRIDRDDLYQSGMIGLIEAAQRFDPSYGIIFSTYAGTRVRGAIVDYLIADLQYRETRGLRDWKKKIADAQSHILFCYQHPPSDEEIAKRLGLSATSYERLRHRLWMLEDQSLEDESLLLAAPIDTASQAVVHQQYALLASAITHLSIREQIVMTLYYQYELADKNIGLIIGVSQPRVHTIRGHAEEKIREYCRTPPRPLPITQTFFDDTPRLEYARALDFPPRESHK